MPGNPNLFQQYINSRTGAYITKACAPGTIFNATTCECSDYGPMGQVYGVEGSKQITELDFCNDYHVKNRKMLNFTIFVKRQNEFGA